MRRILTGFLSAVCVGSAFFAGARAIAQPAPEVSETVTVGSKVRLIASAESTTEVTYQWKKDGTNIAEATESVLALSNVQESDAGSYVVTARNLYGPTESNVARLVVVASPWAGTYVGRLASGDVWALHVADDATGTFVGMMGWSGRMIVARNVKVAKDGTFSFRGERIVAVETSVLASRFYNGSVSGAIDADTGAVSGKVTDADETFSGEKQARAERPPPVVGYYQAVPLASDMGEIHAIAAASGTFVLVAADAAGVRGGAGTIDAEGAFSIEQLGYSYAGVLTAGSPVKFSGTYTTDGGAVRIQFGATTGTRSRGLGKVTFRGLVNEVAPAITVGIGVEGATSGEILFRAAGPALISAGTTGVLLNPRLQLFRGSAVIEENDDWSDGPQAERVAAAGVRAGARAFTLGSEDAALFVQVSPGSYTARISGAAGQSGIVLAEAFDLVASQTESAHLANVSAVGEVGPGGMPVAGLGLSGSAPKKLLIRGIGPTLAAFGVSEPLPAARLQLFRGVQLLRENTSWSSAPDPALVAEAARGAGAFPLPPDSKDAALLLYLDPGDYTVQLNGVADATGSALIEVYEVP